MKIILFSVMMSISAYAQAPLALNIMSNVNPPVTVVQQGASLNLQIVLANSTGQNLAGLEWTESLIPSAITVSGLGSASTGAQKNLFCNLSNLCLLTGFTSSANPPTNAALADGVVVSMTLSVPNTTPTGPQTLSLSNLVAVSTAGVPLPITTTPMQVTVTSACDLNNDGSVNGTDVSLMLSQVTGATACTNDLTGDGKCNVIDLERIIVAALGGACRTGA